MMPMAAIIADPGSGPSVSLAVVVVRLAVAGILGALVGLERQGHGRAAGLRTMMLVSLGCCLVMLMSNAFAEIYWQYRVDGSNILRLDPARLAYSVMGGIGFLGAGTILKSGFNIRGLTTAATIWCVAAIGLATGMGLHFHALVTSLFVLFALFVLDRLESSMATQWYKIIEVILPDEQGVISSFADKIQKQPAKILDMTIDRRGDGTIRVSYSINLPDRRHVAAFFEAIARQPEVQSIHMR